MVVHKIGGCRNKEHGRRGIFNGDSSLVFAGNTTVSLHIYIAYSLQSGRDTFLLHAIDSGEKLGVIPTIGRPVNLAYQSFLACYLQLTGEFHVKRQFFFLAGLQLHNNHIISLRSEYRAFIFHPFIHIGCGSRSITKIQSTLIFCDVLMPQFQFQTTQWQEAHTMRTFEEMLVNKFGSLALLSLENQAAHI